MLPILHFFNDGYLAAMPLLLPYASEEFGLSLGIVGFLGSLLSFSGIILALPAGLYSFRNISSDSFFCSSEICLFN